MNYSLIFAGGTGQRMNTDSLPKQFLQVHGKPVIIHTLLHFEKCEDINGIVVVCYEPYINHLKCLLKEYKIDKVLTIVLASWSYCRIVFKKLINAASIFSGIDLMRIVYTKSGIRITCIPAGISCTRLPSTQLISKGGQSVEITVGHQWNCGRYFANLIERNTPEPPKGGK